MKKTNGYFTTLPNDNSGERFYKIENYDQMDDFFMTITSSSDIWNFCWSHGGITAGRIDCDHALFPYYTADKVADAKSYTGSYTAIRIECDGNGESKDSSSYESSESEIWEPFASLAYSKAAREKIEKGIFRNIYKNTTGTAVWFEEINENLKLSFRYGWTSSAKFGLVRKCVISNLSDKSVKIKILDGCRNILPACVDAAFQNNNSVLLDAYKKTDWDKNSNIALFAVSSIVTDKAEPSEGLFANTCWFSCDEPVLVSADAPKQFAEKGTVQSIEVSKGQRGAAFICKEITLAAHKEEKWNQVFDVRLDYTKIVSLAKQIADRKKAAEELEADIAQTDDFMKTYLSESDGIQNTAETMTCTHHAENVMFNIMRGGFFANNGKISTDDFVKFVNQRNKAEVKNARYATEQFKTEDGFITYSELESSVKKLKDSQLTRLFYEYMPLTFSRRHGDPSRPWNRFNIHLRDNNGNPILNYEGNWRDIFQNWEALAWSYPKYIKNMCAKFLNAMTVEGFNPYRISREGIDWEIPEPDNPWAQIGYWGDHQVIYLQKLLEFYSKTNRTELVSSLNEKQYASSNVPYRIKSYAEIAKNPRDTIIFDRPLSEKLKAKTAEQGSDAKLVCDELNHVEHISLAAKLIQIVIAKAANFVPGGGIWLNTQRPEWNDANNALAGYGLSVVTLNYLYRYLNFLEKLFEESDEENFMLPGAIAECFAKLGELFKNSDAKTTAENSKARKKFTDNAGAIFESERNSLYKNGYSQPEKNLKKSEITEILNAMKNHAETTIRMNRREDSLYHSYNTMKISDDAMEVETLQEMLEGQVAVLSSTLLTPKESLEVLKALKASRIYEPHQNSYMLYPNKELPLFMNKNTVSPQDAAPLADFMQKSKGKILSSDENGNFHFNAEFRNTRFLQDALHSLNEDERATEKEFSELCNLYEKTFNHQSFTGRSGTFYAYEGLGSIYWHMVSKLLLAAQENAFEAKRTGDSSFAELEKAYYDIRSGLSFNKTPELYGAFPADPYSHTPWHQGAKQPGMTGQVKEEVLTRWGELGLEIQDGTASFNPVILKESEFFDDGNLSFSWCGTKVTYKLLKSDLEKTYISVDGIKRDGNSLSKEETSRLFERNGSVKNIEVGIVLK